MYNDAVLNGDLNRVLGNMRHTDRLCIADCGLPIPDGVEVIDLSLKMGEPSFLAVLDVVLEHFGVEKIFLASETESMNGPLYEQLQKRFSATPARRYRTRILKNSPPPAAPSCGPVRTPPMPT